MGVVNFVNNLGIILTSGMLANTRETLNLTPDTITLHLHTGQTPYCLPNLLGKVFEGGTYNQLFLQTSVAYRIDKARLHILN